MQKMCWVKNEDDVIENDDNVDSDDCNGGVGGGTDGDGYNYNSKYSHSFCMHRVLYQHSRSNANDCESVKRRDTDFKIEALIPAT